MPTYRVETDKGTYDIEADREPTQADVMAHLQGLGGDSASKVAPTDVKALQATWANSGPAERAKMLIAHFPGYAKDGAEGTVKMITDMGLEAGGAAAGQALGSMAGVYAPVASRVLGGIGGAAGNAMAQYAGGGPFSAGRVAGAGIAGMIPGASMAKIGAGEVAMQSAKYAAGNTLAKTAQTVVDTGKLPTAEEALMAAGTGALAGPIAKALDKGLNSPTLEAAIRRAKDATRRETIEIGKELGYVIPPSIIRNNVVNNGLNSIGGKAATAQQAQLANQPITNAVVKAELGLADETPLSTGILNALKQVHGKAYDDVAKISPTAGANLELYKQAQADANQLFSTYRSQFPKNPEILAAAKQSQIEADNLFTNIEGEAMALGKPELAANLKDSRVALAKVGLVERSLNKGDGNVSAKVIGEAFDAGERLTGGFEKIGRFQQAFGQLLRDQADTPAPGVNQLTSYLSAGAGMAGASAYGPAGYAMAAVPFIAQPGVRNLMLSRAYQGTKMVQPDYGMTRQDVPAMLARYATMSSGR